MFRRARLSALAAGVLLVALFIPASADPAPTGDITFHCQDDQEYTLHRGRGKTIPFFDPDGTATAIPVTLYFSDANGTRGDLYYAARGRGLVNMPTTWCWSYQSLPGWQSSPFGWMGSDVLFTR